MIQHNPTMHFDTKTGKWQSHMFPPEMPQGGGKRSISDIAAEAEGTRRGMAQAPGRQDSFSSVSSSSSYEEDLAYGKMYDKGGSKFVPGRPTRVMSHERERERPTPFSPAPPPSRPLVNVHAPVELDWYAAQTNSKSQQKPPSAMAQAAMQPLTHAHSRSQPNLLVEMDGTSSFKPNSPRVRPVMVELDARETERYKAYGK
jgi:hypothetical protein